jgi:hypothetical protein
MVSHTLLSAIGITVWTAVLVTAAPRAISHRYGSEHSVEMSTTRDEWPAASCNDLHIQFDGRDGVMQSEERTISKTEASPLRVEGEHNGGVQVEGWDQANYSVTLCKAARAGSDAESVLAQIKVNFSNGQLSVSGPSSRHEWSAHLLIKAPRGAGMELNVHNGPLGLYSVEGNLKVHAVNGPVTVEKCKGDLTVRAENGPISLEENSGKLDVRTQNGPITVNLQGTNWNGAGLEAHATNGPVTLHVPSGYQSGVVLESDGHGPFSCAASVCNEGRKTWDDNSKRVEFGSGPAVVRVSTVNGPVSVN